MKGLIMYKLTKIADNYRIAREYPATFGSFLLMIIEANEFIESHTGHCVTIETKRHCSFIDKKIDFNYL